MIEETNIWQQINNNLIVHSEIAKQKERIPKTIQEHINRNPLMSASGLGSYVLINTVRLLLDFVSYQLNPATSSVDSKFDSQNSIVMGWRKANYKILKHMPLKSHLLRCYTAVGDISDIAEHTRASLLIAALGHDLGKDEEIRKMTGASYGSGNHQKYSADFVKKFYTSSFVDSGSIDMAVVESAIDIILEHHNPSDAVKASLSDLRIFQTQIDYRVRILETELLLNQIKNTVESKRKNKEGGE